MISTHIRCRYLCYQSQEREVKYFYWNVRIFWLKVYKSSKREDYCFSNTCILYFVFFSWYIFGWRCTIWQLVRTTVFQILVFCILYFFVCYNFVEGVQVVKNGGLLHLLQQPTTMGCGQLCKLAVNKHVRWWCCWWCLWLMVNGYWSWSRSAFKLSSNWKVIISVIYDQVRVCGRQEMPSSNHRLEGVHWQRF